MRFWGLVASAVLVAAVSTAQARQVVVSEVMASNVASLTDEDGDTPDWIEIRNDGPEAVALAGYGLTDDPSAPYKWMLPDVSLSPGGLLLVLASGKDRPGAVGTWETVVDRGTVWRYLIGSSTPSPSWTSPAYNDSPWTEGPSGFGYGDGDDATTVPARTLTVYVRTEFDVPDVSALVGAYFHVDYDDAYVAYLNGVEIGRANIGSPGAPTSAGQTAIADREARMYSGGDPEGIRLTDLPSLFVSGRNVLAVEVHNVGTGSSDLSLIPFLTLAYDSPEVSFDGVSNELDGLFELQTHTSFRVSEGETVCVTPPSGEGADCLEISVAPVDISLGHDPVTGGVGFFASPTPGLPNSDLAYAGQAPAPDFSHQAGSYATPFTLTVTSDEPGARIAVTTDGSDPPESASSTGLTMSVNGTAVVRARVVVPGMLPGPVVTNTYLLGPTRDLPVISISTTPARLWDEDTGIYVKGPPGTYDTGFPYFGSNFWEEWEIPVHMEWFEPGGERTFQADVGAQIFGGWSRGHNQKSLALYARGEYGPGALEYPFFANRPFDEYQNLVLRNSGNDWNSSMLRDGFMQTLVLDTEIDGMAYRPGVVFLNGEYWGIHNVREKINEHYVASVGGADPDGIDMIEYASGAGVQVIHGDKEHYDAMIQYMEQADMTTIEALEQVQRRLDLDNWIDYQLAQIFFDNRDWPGNNSKAWRPKTEDGRWRFILYDTDFGWNGINSSYTNNTLAFASESSGPDWPNPPYSTYILRRLMTNGRFRRLFVNRFADYMNHHFDPDRTVHVLDSLAGAIDGEMPRHFSRWGSNYSNWVTVIQSMRLFAERRPEYMLQHMRNLFGLSGTAAVTVQVAPPGGGRIRVNRLAVGTGPWSGDYFGGIPVPLTAIPDPGFRFAGWTGSAESTAHTIELDPSGGLDLTAHFVDDALVASDVVVNEIHYHPSDDMPSEDWLELANTSTSALDLSGWSIGDGSNAFTLPAGTTIPAAGFVVLCQDPAAYGAAYGGNSCLGGWTFGLSASGEAVYLRDGTGVLVDSVAFGDGDPWPDGPDGQGPSLELTDPLADNALPGSWSASTVTGGTPGARNSTATAIAPEPELPTASPRISVFPNPFAGRATFYFEARAGGDAVIEVFDALGRLVDRVPAGRVVPGPNGIVWDAPRTGAGMRFVRLVVDGMPLASSTVVQVD